MYYTEYAIAATTHYKSCKFMYDSCIIDNQIKSGGTKDVLYRLLYICGHIIECASIYLIFKHFRYEYNPYCLNWKGGESHLHKSYNCRFTRDSHMDYYPITIENGYILSSYRGSGDKDFVFGRSALGESKSDYYNVKNHEFQKYIENIIHTQLPQDVPYLRPRCPEDNEYLDAINLIDSWSTDMRYYYEGRQSGHYNKSPNTPEPRVDVESVGLVLKMCEKIVGLLPSGRQL